MARTARKKSKSGIYHVVLRGINKQTVFYDDEDKEVFLSRLKLAKEKFDYQIYAFCFMSNHVHLLIKESVSIGKIMQIVLASYIFWYNSKYERVGNLFQDRYKSEPIEDDPYMLCAIRYIHQNPVKAKMVKNASDYKWSSYSAYLSANDNLIDKNLVLDMLQGQEQYIKFMDEPEDIKLIEPNDYFKISDDKLLKEIKKKLKIKEISEIYALPRKERNEKLKLILKIEGSNPYQVSRVTGIPMGVIRGLSA